MIVSLRAAYLSFLRINLMMSRRKWPIHQALTKGRLKNRTSSILCGPHSVRKAKTPRSWKILENQISIVRLGAKIYSPAQNKMTWWVCRREKECKNWWCLIPSLRKTNSNLWDSLGLSCRMMRWLLAVVKQRGDTSCSSLLLGEWQRNSTKKVEVFSNHNSDNQDDHEGQKRPSFMGSS